MTISARDGLVWIREAMRIARANAGRWTIRTIALVLIGTLLGLLVLGPLYGIMLHLFPSAPDWVGPLGVQTLARGITGLLVVGFWFFAMRDLNDAPRLGRRQWKSTVMPTLFWILAPFLTVTVILMVLHVVMDGSPAFFAAAGWLGRLLSLWTLGTMMIGGVLVDRSRQPQGLTPWFSVQPWGEAWAVLRRQWLPLIVAFVVPLLALALVALAFMTVLPIVARPLIGGDLTPWLVDHQGVAWILRFVVLAVVAVFFLIANLGLVVGYLRTRPGTISTTAVLDTLDTTQGARAVATDAPRFPPLS